MSANSNVAGLAPNRGALVQVKTSREFLEQKDTLELQHRQLLDTLAAERKAFEKQIRWGGLGGVV